MTVKDVDPSKYGFKSFDTMFDDLSDEPQEEESSLSQARLLISRGQALSQHQPRKEEVQVAVQLDDLDDELDKLLQEGEVEDLELDDKDFDAVGGRYHPKRWENSDDDTSSEIGI